MESTSLSGHYEPPRYSISMDSQSPYIHSVQPATQQWNNDSPPPAYDTIDSLPTLDDEYPSLYPSPTTQIWIQRTQNNDSPIPQVSYIPPNIQQAPSPPSQSISPELSGLSTLSNRNTAALQTTDLKQNFRRFRPRVLGIVLIIVFLAEISLGVSVVPSTKDRNMNSLLYGTLFWVPWFHIVTGTILIWSWTNTSVCSVRCVLYFGVLSFIASIIGLVFNSYDLHHLNCLSYINYFKCGLRYGNDKEIVIFSCLVGLNTLAMFLTLFASCVGSATLAKRSPPPYVITVTSSW